jgi:hypothetical protein
MKKLTKKEIEEGKTVIEICEWMKSHDGKFPSKNSNDPIEKKLGNRVSQLRQVKSGKLKNEKNEQRKFNVMYQTIAEKYGYSEMFTLYDNQKASENMVKEICEWMKSHEDKSPSKKSKDPIEKKLGEALSAIKQSIHNKKQDKSKGGRVFYPSLLTIAEECGYPALFELHDNKSVSEGQVKEICEWMKENNRKPNKNSDDSVEKKLGIVLSSLKRARHNKKTYRVFYPSLQTIAEEYGYPELFEYGTREVSLKRKEKSIEIPKEMAENMIPEKRKKEKV